MWDRLDHPAGTTLFRQFDAREACVDQVRTGKLGSVLMGTPACSQTWQTDLNYDRRSAVMPRVAPITGKSDVPAEHHALVDGVLKVFGGIRGPFSVLLHSPKMAQHVFSLGNYFREESVVEPKLRVLAILVAARERQGAYVWAAQVNAARRAGVPEATIDLIRSKAELAKFSAEEREIVAYAEQLMRTNRVEQATFDALKNRYGVQWLLELTTVSVYYAALSGVVSAFEVPAAPDADRLP
jgi:4-carboxymuconolactone decarboxylase